MSVNDFNKGTESLAKAHYVFMRKQGVATAELGKRIIKKIDHLGNIVDVLIDELNQQEMDRVFGICSSLDIGVLDSSDQIKLLSYLKTMTTRRGQTAQQQLDYFFAVKRYLNIGNVADTIDFNAVSKLDLSRSELKAFFECVCEFLFLKSGTNDFLDVFKDELDCFGFNDKIVGEIVSTIEKTYDFFGIQGIIEHYSLEPIKREQAEEEPLRIPFFEKPFAIVYDGKEKHHGEYAERLKSSIEERLDFLGIKAPEIRIEDDNEPEISIKTLSETRHIIYIGEPKSGKDFLPNVENNWDYDMFGMKYGTLGKKSIINVIELKAKQYKSFLDYAKEERVRQMGDIEKNIKDQHDTILKSIFDKDEPLAVNIMMGILSSWLILPSALLDLTNKADYKEKLKGLQYGIAIDKFVASKIDPYLTEKVRFSK